MVDHWEPIIIENVSKVLSEFSNVKITPVRNSSMKKFGVMRKVVLETIKNPKLVWNVLKKFSNKKMLEYPCAYCSAICRNCKSARTETSVKSSELIEVRCPLCGDTNSGVYETFEYWLYHKPLALPRIAYYNIDLCITGLDHYNEGDFASRLELFKAYDIYIYKISQNTVYTISHG